MYDEHLLHSRCPCVCVYVRTVSTAAMLDQANDLKELYIAYQPWKLDLIGMDHSLKTAHFIEMMIPLFLKGLPRILHPRIYCIYPHGICGFLILPVSPAQWRLCLTELAFLAALPSSYSFFSDMAKTDCIWIILYTSVSRLICELNRIWNSEAQEQRGNWKKQEMLNIQHSFITQIGFQQFFTLWMAKENDFFRCYAPLQI